MTLTHKQIPLQAIESSVYGLLWTRRGPQIVRPGDMIVTAPTGCTWRIRKHTLQFYERTQDAA